MSATLNELTNNPAERIKSILSSLRCSPKLLLVICGAAALSVIIALMFWAKEPDYRVLFSNISDEEGARLSPSCHSSMCLTGSIRREASSWCQPPRCMRCA